MRTVILNNAPHPTFNISELRRIINHANYGMLHTTFPSMKHPEVYVELMKEIK